MKGINIGNICMENKDLIWEVGEKEMLLHTPVYDVYSQKETAPNGISGNYITADAPDWVMVIPVIDNNFLLVKQWRHSMLGLSIEFPGGVCDKGENPEVSALRELKEETGYEPGKLTKLGSICPNPALFGNKTHIFLAEDLKGTGVQKLDEDELLEYLQLPIDEVIKDYGSELYQHGLMGTALAFYLRYKYVDKK